MLLFFSGAKLYISIERRKQNDNYLMQKMLTRLFLSLIEQSQINEENRKTKTRVECIQQVKPH